MRHFCQKCEAEILRSCWQSTPALRPKPHTARLALATVATNEESTHLDDEATVHGATKTKEADCFGWFCLARRLAGLLGLLSCCVSEGLAAVAAFAPYLQVPGLAILRWHRKLAKLRHGLLLDSRPLNSLENTVGNSNSSRALTYQWQPWGEAMQCDVGVDVDGDDDDSGRSY